MMKMSIHYACQIPCVIAMMIYSSLCYEAYRWE